MTKFPAEQAFPKSASEKSRGVARVPVTAKKKKKKANIPSWEERPHPWREKLRAVLTEQIQIPVKVERECFKAAKGTQMWQQNSPNIKCTTLGALGRWQPVRFPVK